MPARYCGYRLCAGTQDAVREKIEQLGWTLPRSVSLPGCASGWFFALYACGSCMLCVAGGVAELEDQGGWRARRQRYRQLSERIRSKLATLGVPTYLDVDAYSSMISSFRLPNGQDTQAFMMPCAAAVSIIYAGQSGLYWETFRIICTMGDIQMRIWCGFWRRWRS